MPSTEPIELLSEHAAWLAIAQAFSTPGRKRNVDMREMTNEGLCHAVDCLGYKSKISRRTNLNMHDRLGAILSKEFNPDYQYGYLWPTRLITRNGKYDKKRADLARRFAEECVSKH